MSKMIYERPISMNKFARFIIYVLEISRGMGLRAPKAWKL